MKTSLNQLRIINYELRMNNTSTSSVRATNKLIPELRFPEFVNEGDWEEKKLGEIAENLDSKRVPITSNQREKGNVPYYGASGIIDYVKEYIYNENLLCISEDGANLIDRNYPIAFSISGKTWVNNHAHVLRFENSSTQKLVEKYINSINIEDFLTGMAQPKLNRGKLDIIPIPLPKKPKEQHKIASFLSSLDDTVIGLPANLFYSTGIPVCILVLKKCKKQDDVLFINASEHYQKGKRQNTLREGENGEPNDIQKIVETYQFRHDIERYSRKVSMDEIEKNGYNLNISRYVSTSVDEVVIDLKKVNEELIAIEKKAKEAANKHNQFLKELGLPPI